jgi:ABC-type multidrug transport system fused ATPase/permease subunit
MGHGGLFVWSVVAGVGYHAFSIGAAVTGAWLVGQAAVGHPAGDLTPLLWPLGAFVVIAGLVRWWHYWLAHDFAYGLLAEFRIRVFEGLAHGVEGRLTDHRTGDLASTVMSDVEVTERFYAHTVADYVIALLVTAGSIAVLAAIDPLFVAAQLPFVVLITTIPLWLQRQANARGRRLREALGRLNALVVDGIQGLRELAVFGQGGAYRERLDRNALALQALQSRYGKRAGAEQAAASALSGGAVLTAVGCGAVLVGKGDLSLPLYLVAVILAGDSMVALSEVAHTARDFGQIRASAQRVYSIIDQRPNAMNRDEKPSVEPAVYRIEFRNVRFRYPSSREEVLQGVTFTVDAGEQVVLVGQSGVGKSTCANLLLRLWEPDSGEILLGGHDVRAYPQGQLRDLIAFVPQDVYLFNASIGENIRLGKPDADDAAVERAARLAQAHDFIVADLPDGYGTVCGERGVKLSGGQRQRVAIARALLKDAPVLVMDEALSEVDAENELALQTAIRNASRCRTTILISHRLSTIRRADRILVIENGRVVEEGDHHTLIDQQGFYARLIASRNSGFVDV